MKKVSSRALADIIESTPVVILQWSSNRCVPCKNQQVLLEKTCASYHPNTLQCVQIDIDQYQRGLRTHLKKYGIQQIPNAIPATMAFVNGTPQKFHDSTLLNGHPIIVTSLYGLRYNIDKVVTESVKKAKGNHK